jgi:two-component system sensor histidine kinase RegB
MIPHMPFTHERHIALPWLAHLRWLAVAGQITATSLCVFWLKMDLPLQWIGWVILITALTNVLLQTWLALGEPPDWVLPGILLLDVLLLTALLYCTGGSQNPFSTLYIVHVAMAVVALERFWTWVISTVAAICYGVVFWWNQPLRGQQNVSPVVLELSKWLAIVLAMVIISYFIGRVMRALRLREIELAEMRERARRTDHLAALTTLAAGAAHELGTPLGTIAVVAKEVERSSRQGADIASIAEDAKLIRQEVDRCRSILDRMRVDVIEDLGEKPTFAELRALLAQLQEDLKPNEKDRLTIETTAEGSLVIPRAAVLRRAVGVLLRNAFDATPPGQNVVLRFTRTDGRVVFEVLDRGPGMTAEVLRRAGEPFFTTKAPGAGMGLGLFLVRLVADTYGGGFSLQSAPGTGTRSVLELKVSHEDSGGGRRRDVSDAAGEGVREPGVSGV